MDWFGRWVRQAKKMELQKFRSYVSYHCGSNQIAPSNNIFIVQHHFVSFSFLKAQFVSFISDATLLYSQNVSAIPTWSRRFFLSHFTIHMLWHCSSMLSKAYKIDFIISFFFGKKRRQKNVFYELCVCMYQFWAFHLYYTQHNTATTTTTTKIGLKRKMINM